MALAGVSNSDLADLIATTTENLPKMTVEYALNYQTFEVINRWFQKDKIQIGDGTEILRDIVLDRSGNANHVKLYQELTINVVDVASQIKAPWRQLEYHWSIERREAARNSKPAQFVNLVDMRRNESAVGAAELLEERAWLSPDSSSDDLNPYGIPYWIPKLAAGQAGEGFYGGSDTTYATTTGNIDPATTGDNTVDITGGKPLWRSYCAGGTAYYDSMNATALRTMLKMFLKIQFQSPYTVKDLELGPLSNYRIYCNTDSYVALVELCRQQNENIGADLARYNGITVFSRVPIIHIPYLDNDTSDPVYMVNHNKFEPFVLDGDYFRESPPMNSREQSNVFTTVTDLSYNFLCTNRRMQGVMNKTA